MLGLGGCKAPVGTGWQVAGYPKKPQGSEQQAPHRAQPLAPIIDPACAIQGPMPTPAAVHSNGGTCRAPHSILSTAPPWPSSPGWGEVLPRPPRSSRERSRGTQGHPYPTPTTGPSLRSLPASRPSASDHILRLFHQAQDGFLNKSKKLHFLLGKFILSHFISFPPIFFPNNAIK